MKINTMNTGSLMLLLTLPVLVTCQGLVLPDSTRRIFMITIGHDYGAHEYIDSAGYLTGFVHDLIDAVCTEAGMDCRTVWDRTENCWQSNGPGALASGGKGIYDRYYDACTGWDATRQRIHTFQFSAPYTRTLKSFFFYKKGGAFDERDLAQKTVGFVMGWASSDQCVANLNIKNNIMMKDYIKYYNTADELLMAVKNSQVAAAFADELTFSSDEIATSLDYNASRSYVCILAGNSLMSRKDNDISEFWNIGFRKLTSTGRYKKLCAAGTKKHGHKGDLYCLNKGY